MFWSLFLLALLKLALEPLDRRTPALWRTLRTFWRDRGSNVEYRGGGSTDGALAFVPV